MQFKALLVFWESLIKWRYQKCELNVSQLRNPIYSLHELWGWTVYVCMFLTWSPWFKETSKSIENNDESVESVRCKRNPPTFRKVNQTSCPLLSCHLPHCMLGLNSPAPQILILWQPTILLVAFIALTKLSSLQMLLVRVNLIKKKLISRNFPSVSSGISSTTLDCLKVESMNKWKLYGGITFLFRADWGNRSELIH